MRDQTIHKAVASFLSAFVMLLVAFGVPVPEWFSGDVISWIATIVAALVGAGVPGIVTWWVANQPK